MARLLSLPRRLVAVLLTLIFALIQFVRGTPVQGMRRPPRARNASYTIDRALLFRLAREKGGNLGRSYGLRATGSFPYVKLVAVTASEAVPVPLLLPGVARAQARGPGLLHAAIGGLSAPQNQQHTPPVRPACIGSCGGCGSCGSCASCSSCSSCTSCVSCAGCSNCISCSNCASCTSCLGNCGFTSCGGSCFNCASCASCYSCTSCVCTSCSSCASCGSCSSCVG